MNDIKISVIIPVQNGAATIERLLGSLIIQKQNVHEVLVCNDHSTDNTVEIVKRYTPLLPITILDVPDDLGNNPGHARQVGLDHATGDWVVFADADDILTFNALGYYKAQFKSNPDIKMIVASFDEVHYDPFYVIEHLSQPFAWVHAKAFDLQYIKDRNIRFHDTLYTHEDKYFTCLTLFTLRADGMEPLCDDITTYYWCRSNGTIVDRDGGKYPTLSLVESMDALIEPCELVVAKYNLSHKDIQDLFGYDLFSTLLDSYHKVQGSVFKFGDQILSDYHIMEQLPSRIARIKKLTGWTNEEILAMCIDRPEAFNNAKADTVRTICDFIVSQTFTDFLNEVSPDNVNVTK